MKEVERKAEDELDDVQRNTQRKIDVRTDVKINGSEWSQKPHRTGKKRKEKYGKYK